MMAREWMDLPTGLPVATPYGNVYLSPTDGRHVYVDANSNGKRLTVKGREFTATLHAYRQEDGTWSDRDPERYNGGTSFYGSRVGSFDYSRDAIPPTFRASIVAAMVAAVGEWVAQYPGLLHAAEIANLNNQLRSLEEDREKLMAQLAAVDHDMAITARKLRATEDRTNV
jgi:hypothetical protein